MRLRNSPTLQNSGVACPPGHRELRAMRPRSPSVPRYRDNAESVAMGLLAQFDLCIENVSSRLSSFRSKQECRRWKVELRRTARRYCALIETMPGIVREDGFAFREATLGMLQDVRFSELALVREIYLARRKRRSGRGPRGFWLAPDGRWLRKLPTHHRISQMARAMDVKTPHEPVARRVKRKATGYRITFAFSLPDQAKKRQVADLVEAVCAPNPYDFGRDSKGGHHGAAQVIRKSISREECRHFAVADLRDAYPSITARHIADVIPLDPIVIRNVVTVRADLTLVSSAFPAPTGRRLPQGAVSSAPILSALLGRSLRPLAGPRRVIVNQGDDILIGTQTKDEADVALRELTRRLLSLPAGPLRFGKAEIQSPYNRRKLSFCGYAHRVFFDTGRVHCAPADKSIDKMKVKLGAKLRQTPDQRRRRVQREYLDCWSRSFPCWTRNRYSIASIANTADTVRARVRIEEQDQN